MFQPDPRHLTKESFDKSYDGEPPWEIGRPQPELLKLLDEFPPTGNVLDVGCGTGELALEIARRGIAVVGVDSSAKAIARAKQKATKRGLAVPFHVFDVLKLEERAEQFDLAIDCGLFHVFSDVERPVYVAGLTHAVRPGGALWLICFSELETREGGPRRVTQAELRSSFANGWLTDEIRAARFDSLIHAGGAAAWLARMTRV